jgi:hypothetical protein
VHTQSLQISKTSNLKDEIDDPVAQGVETDDGSRDKSLSQLLDEPDLNPLGAIDVCVGRPVHEPKPINGFVL